MLAYALISKPCSETTDIGYIFFGGSICSNLQKKFDIEQFNIEWFDSKQFIQRNKKIRRYREERRNDRIYCALFGQHDDAECSGR